MGKPPVVCNETLIDHCMEYPTHTIRQQMELLGSVSNYHWWVSLTIDRLKRAQTTRVRMSQHVMVTSTEESPNFFPASPRNQLMFSKLKGYSDRFLHTAIYIMRFDRKEEHSVVFGPGEEEGGEAESEDSQGTRRRPKKKKRRYATKVVPLTQQEFCETLSVDPLSVQNLAKEGLFSSFSQELISDGVLVWRKFAEGIDIVAMSDYSPTTGKIQPLSYVHVSAVHSEEDRCLVRCSCSMYQTIEGVAIRRTNLEMGEEIVLDAVFTCMHCRFYMQYLKDSRADFHEGNPTSHVLSVLQKKREELNNPVVLLGLASENFTTKFSVVVDQESSLVHVHFTPSGCFARCMRGTCQSSPFLTRRRLPKGLPMESSGQRKGVCTHLDTFFANCEILRELFPRVFPAQQSGSGSQAQGDEEDQEEVDFSESQEESQGAPDVDDVLLETLQERIWFDVQEERWRCNSLSQYKPTRDMNDPPLLQRTAHRSLYVRPDEMLEGGCYRGPVLKPAVPEGPCQCGAAFTSEEFPDGLTEPSHEAKVYTKSVSIDQGTSCSKLQLISLP